MPAPAKTRRPARTRLPHAASPWEARRRRGAGHALKRDAVILAAARAFRERGYHNTSLDDLAASLKVTKPTLYLYVPNKEAILFECFRAGLAQIQATLDGMRERRRARRASGCSPSSAAMPRPSSATSAGACCAPRTSTWARP